MDGQGDQMAKTKTLGSDRMSTLAFTVCFMAVWMMLP